MIRKHVDIIAKRMMSQNLKTATRTCNAQSRMDVRFLYQVVYVLSIFWLLSLKFILVWLHYGHHILFLWHIKVQDINQEGYSTVNFTTPMHGFACHRNNPNENMTGLNMKMDGSLGKRISAKVFIQTYHYIS